jgi:acetyl-CoA carboxylase carboxyltransferase component
MMNKEMKMILTPMNPADILRMSNRQAANVAFANSRAEMLKPVDQKMKELEQHFRAVLAAQCESYKELVIDTYLDCEYTKVKISKRIAKPRKKDFAGGMNKGAICK